MAQQDGYAIESYQAEQLDLSSLYEIVEQDGLFTKKANLAEQSASEFKLLQTAKEAYARLDGSNQLVIFYESDKVNPKVLNALAAQTHKITCYEPYPREFAQCCLDLAKFYQLDIDYTAASFLVERLGHDLFKIDSELKKSEPHLRK